MEELEKKGMTQAGEVYSEGERTKLDTLMFESPPKKLSFRQNNNIIIKQQHKTKKKEDT